MDRCIAVFFIITIILMSTNANSLGRTSRQTDASFSGQGQTQTQSIDGNKQVEGDQQQLPTVRPTFGSDVARRVNDGLSTILGGVRNLSLEQILRGSFAFTRNENVRTVANNVLDNVFFRTGGDGPIDQAVARYRSMLASTGGSAASPQ